MHILMVLPFLLASYYTYYGSSFMVVSCWLLGLLALCTWGVVEWWRTRPVVKSGALLVAALLTLLALVVRFSQSPRELPGFIHSDEQLLVGTTKYLAGHLDEMLSLFWVGIPIFEMLPQALAYYAVGDAVSPLLLVRLVNGLFGALSVLGIYVLGRSLVNERVAVAAGVLLAVSHVSINYSRVALPFIQTAAYGSLFMAFAVRACQGGSYLNWVGAALNLGFGVMSYQAAYFFPGALVVSLLPFFFQRWNPIHYRKARSACAFILLYGGLVAAPPFLKILRDVPWERSRVAALLINSSEAATSSAGIAPQGFSQYNWLVNHIFKSFKVFWSGRDGHTLYAADQALLDPIVGALFALSPILLLRRPLVEWICLVWAASAITIGLVLCHDGMSYHRILVAVGFASLAAATLVDTFLPRRVSRLALSTVVIGAAYWNLSWYFVRYAGVGGLTISSAVSDIICPFSQTHSIIDAAGLDDGRWGAEHQNLVEVECTPRSYKRVSSSSEAWALVATTTNKSLLITRPAILEKIDSQPPPGFTVIRQWQDNRAQRPQTGGIVVFELERR